MSPGPSRLAMPAFPVPKQLKSHAIPGEHGFGFDNDESRVPLWPKSGEPNLEESVPRSDCWSIGGTLQDDDLVS
jgi:hypothetical protein